MGRTVDDKTPERSRRRVAQSEVRKRRGAGFFAACFVKIEVLAKTGNVFLRCFAVGDGLRRSANGNGAFGEGRKDAEILRTADVDVGAARRLKRGEIGVVGVARPAVAFGRRSFSNEKRLDLNVWFRFYGNGTKKRVALKKRRNDASLNNERNGDVSTR